MQPADDPTIETDDDHRLTLWRRFGNANFKAREDLRLLGWDPSGAILHLQPQLWSTVPRVEQWDLRTGERLTSTVVAWGVPFAGLDIDAACSPIIRAQESPERAQVTELWNLRAPSLLGTFRRWVLASDLATSADGRITVSGDYRIEVYGLPGSQVLGAWSGDRPVAVSPDGSLIVSRPTSRESRAVGPLRVSRPDGTPVATLPPSGLGGASAATFSRDGRRVIAGSTEGELACWQASTGERLWRVRPHGDDAPRVIAAVAPSADGETFFALDAGDRLCALSAAGALRWRATLRRSADTAPGGGQIVPSPDGASLAVCSRGRSPRIVDAATGADRTPTEGHRGRLVALALSPDGRLAASGDDEGELRVYDLAGGDTMWTLEVDKGEVLGAEFSRDGRSLRTAGRDGCVRRWSLATGFEEAHWRVRRSKGLRTIEARDGARVLVSTDERLQLWSDEDATLVRWSQRIKCPARFDAAFRDDESRVVVVAFGSSAWGYEGWTLATLDAATGRRVGEETMPDRLIGLRATDAGPLSISRVDDRLVVREAFGERREVAAREASASVTSVEVSADGRWMALADDDRVELWSLAPPARCVARLPPVEGFDSIARLALPHDGAVLVVGTACGVVTAYARTEVG